MSNTDALLVLNAISGLGPVRILKLIKEFSSPAKALLASEKELVSRAEIPLGIAKNIKTFDADCFLRKEHALIKQKKVAILCVHEKDYPDSLKQLNDPPVVLYIKGAIKKEDRLAIAIVGSRRSSVYGLSTAEKIAINLCDYGVTIVSGLARGIDTAAHRGALRAQGRTLAILGSGLARIYPEENKKMSEDIAHHGAVISEFPMTAAPLGCHFPRRNRIVSGLSLGVVVVEAAKKSGALITADFALEQGKDVFAVPGKVDSPLAQGVNNLIKQGAKLISGAEDIIEELGLEMKRSMLQQKDNVPQGHLDLTTEEKGILNLIPLQGIHIDQLLEQSLLLPSQLSRILLSLSLKKHIQQLPGKIFAQIEK